MLRSNLDVHQTRQKFHAGFQPAGKSFESWEAVGDLNGSHFGLVTLCLSLSLSFSLSLCSRVSSLCNYVS